MARLLVSPPDHFIYRVEIPVRVADLNYGGHVGNDSVLTIMQEARVLFYRSLGFESEIRIAGDVGQIITDAAIQYKSESFLGDILVVEIGIKDITKYSFDMYYRLSNKVTGKVTALGKTGVASYDYALRKIAPLPEPFLTKLTAA